jgi:ABC-type glycerol-3-phosphate transport system permease component
MTLQAVHPDAFASRPTVATRPTRSWFNRNRSAIIRHAVINFFMVVIILPLFWVLIMSVKSRPDAMRADFWPRHFDFTHYSYVFNKIDTLPRNLFNSIYVTSGTVLITTVCAVLAGYALVHLRPRGGGLLVAALLASLYFPVRVVSLISIYEIQNFLGLINSTSGLILPYVTLNLAISVLIMRSMFQLVPHELIEAAKIDGAGHWRTLWMVGLPMVRNGLVVIFIVNFVTAWGEFLLCTTLTNDQNARTMPVVLAAAQGGLGQWSWPNLASVYVIVVTPGILAFTFAQRLFFKGLMEGAIKG